MGSVYGTHLGAFFGHALIVRTMNVTRSRSISRIFPAATSRSSALVFPFGNVVHFPFLDPDRGTLGPITKSIHKPRLIVGSQPSRPRSAASSLSSGPGGFSRAPRRALLFRPCRGLPRNRL